MSIESVIPSNHLILCCPLLLLPSVFPNIRVFSKWVSSLHQVAEVLEFHLHLHQSFQWPPKTDFFYDGLVGSPCSLRDSQESSPNYSSKASILWHSSFFIVQLSHPCMTTGKTIALTRQTFVDKGCLLFNMLSRLVITFLPRNKHLLIYWLQSPSAVILEPRKIKSATVSPSISHEVVGPDSMILVFWILSFKPTFSLSSFTFIKRLFSSSSLSAKRMVSSAYRRRQWQPTTVLLPGKSHGWRSLVGCSPWGP